MINLFALVSLVCSVSMINAGINFGDKNSAIVVEDGSTFVIAGNLSVNGTLINNGTLTIEEDVHFNTANGTFIDHGGTILMYHHDRTIYNDIALSSTSTLTISHGDCDDEGGTITITGSGQKISFAQEGCHQLIIGDNTVVVFENIELVGFHPGAISLGDGAELHIASGGLTLTQNVDDLNYPIYFTGTECHPSVVRGNQYHLSFGCEGNFTLGSHDYLRIEDTVFVDAQGSLFDAQLDSHVTLHNCVITMSDKVHFCQGYFTISGTTSILGESETTFKYSSPYALEILELSSLMFDGCKFSFHVSCEGDRFISGQSRHTSSLILQDAQLSVRVPALTLNRLKMVSRNQSVIKGKVIDESVSAIAFGDGECHYSNSTLAIETGTLELTDIACLIQDVSCV